MMQGLTNWMLMIQQLLLIFLLLHQLAERVGYYNLPSTKEEVNASARDVCLSVC